MPHFLCINCCNNFLFDRSMPCEEDRTCTTGSFERFAVWLAKSTFCTVSTSIAALPTTASKCWLQPLESELCLDDLLLSILTVRVICLVIVMLMLKNQTRLCFGPVRYCNWCLLLPVCSALFGVSVLEFFSVALNFAFDCLCFSVSILSKNMDVCEGDFYADDAMGSRTVTSVSHIDNQTADKPGLKDFLTRVDAVVIQCAAKLG